MIKEAISTGATIEEAKDSALAELNAPEGADITIEVLEMPVKKTFGLFGGNPAKVRVSYEATEPETKTEAVIKTEPFEAQKPENIKNQNQKQKQKKQKFEKQDTPLLPAEGYEETQAYLTALITGMGASLLSMSISEKDEDVYIELDCGDDHSFVIGRRGETLDALQYLTRLNVSRNKEGYRRVLINVGNYRERREATLKGIAAKNAEKAKKYGRNIYLDPMNPYERRIIHTEIQKIEGVESHSVGSDADRRVVITPNSPRRNGNASSYTRGRSNDTVHTKIGDKERKPRSDFAGATLYGKIEPKNSIADQE
ncbi:MAG TPA: RNA-binding cell elongation regulator Jag/EloR [Clostridiales bacterium]|jgi:spoIIIJ-associated protein|nr:RNA-binding cell elongation regulator Jag/EloR [Clostridiales bacterium]HRT81672.1 RNA-binding cell elongation regulator Jag/EloR [Oscillospiraceae bacterium]